MDAQSPATLIDATWPAEFYHADSGFMLRQTPGGGNRVNAASWEGEGTPSDAAISEAISTMRGMSATPRFRVDNRQNMLAERLEQRGFIRRFDTVELSLTRPKEAPRPSAELSACWPPTPAMQRLWQDGGINTARIAIMERVQHPKTAIRWQENDLARGVVFVASAGQAAMFHALHVAPEARRKGIGSALVQAAAEWAAAEGAQSLHLLVTRENTAAIACYEALGFAPSGGYAYWVKD